jgi:hypothetical protein
LSTTGPGTSCRTSAASAASFHPHFDGGVLAELQRLAAAGTIRVLDFLLVHRGDDDVIRILEIEDLPPAQASALGHVGQGTAGLLSQQDAGLVAEGLVPGSAAAVLAIEHLWVTGLRDALIDAGADVAVTYRVPAVVVDEGYAAQPVGG